MQEVLSKLADGTPVELVKGVVIGYDNNGVLRMYNSDLTQEELIVACELTKCRAMGLVNTNDLSSMVANQLAMRVKSAGGPEVIRGTKTED